MNTSLPAVVVTIGSCAHSMSSLTTGPNSGYNQVRAHESTSELGRKMGCPGERHAGGVRYWYEVASSTSKVYRTQD
jgi:hypothetical protein